MLFWICASLLFLARYAKADLPTKVVVIMFENHAFDNLLGYLWEDVPDKTGFEGVVGKNLSNPVPAAVESIVGAPNISVYKGTVFSFPYFGLTPGEEYPYINTALFNTLDPQNANIPGTQTTSPYNLPAGPLPNPAPLNGFITMYLNALNGTELFDNTRLNQSTVLNPNNFGAIMTCLPNSEIPVLTSLARDFAVFDHWFCDVPTQTYPNRGFFHSATSNGQVLNHFPDVTKLTTENNQRTIFNQLQDAGVSWGVYFPGFISITLLLHFAQLRQFHKNFHSMDDFYSQAAAGTLPQYSFVEPEFVGAPTDYHPTDNDNTATNHSSILAGEIYLKTVYDGLKGSPDRDNLLFVVTFDESGGTYDHVSPPTGVTPPDNSPQEMNFTFDRLGNRVPMIWISSYISPNTTIQTQLQHTSFMRFLRTLFNLPNTPLTNRDRDAPDVPLGLFGTVKRDWPEVTARPYDDSGNVDDKVDEMSYFVALAQQIFQTYLQQLECDVNTWLGNACTPANNNKLTMEVKEIIIIVVAGTFLLFCFCCCCCYKNGEYGKRCCNGCCCRAGGFGSTGEYKKKLSEAPANSTGRGSTGPEAVQLN